jgi:hypothetical protein
MGVSTTKLQLRALNSKYIFSTDEPSTFFERCALHDEKLWSILMNYVSSFSRRQASVYDRELARGKPSSGASARQIENRSSMRVGYLFKRLVSEHQETDDTDNERPSKTNHLLDLFWAGEVVARMLREEGYITRQLYPWGCSCSRRISLTECRPRQSFDSLRVLFRQKHTNTKMFESMEIQRLQQ